ncbi:HU family DNA-binding protein [Candidatus Bipolaricaulota bacterium]|nr:HU family DNA-binding protein [Candidatus Bipolaricaulota bacterium]
MNKAELAEKLAAKAGLTKKGAYQVIDGIIDVITESLTKSEAVNLTGFGKFEVRSRKATTRINPQSGKKFKVPAKVVPAFKPGKNLKETVAKKAKK